MDRIASDKREEWEHLLHEPVAGDKPAKVSEAVLEEEGRLFMAAMAQTQGG